MTIRATLIMSTAMRLMCLLLMLAPMIAAAQTVSVTAIEPAADELGQDAAIFRFTRTGSTANALAVNITRDPTTTASNADFLASNGSSFISFNSVTFAAGQSTFDLVLTPTLDNLVEGEEVLDITLAPGSYLIGSPSSAGVTFADDPPVLSITVVHEKAVEGGAAGILAVGRTGGNVNQALIANASISAASTADDSDFTVDDGGALQAFGTVNIPAGQTARELAFTAINDGLVEDEELLILELQAGSYLQGSPSTGTLNFIDDALFADRFESPVAGLDACSLDEHTDLSPFAFDIDGRQGYDYVRGLTWLRCASIGTTTTLFRQFQRYPVLSGAVSG